MKILRKSSRIFRYQIHRIGISVVLAGVTFAACGSSSSSSTAAGAQSSSATSTTAANEAAAAYFKGKTITLIAPDNPGGGFDMYARTLAPALSKYLGATVNVENVNGAGTLVGTNQMAASSPNGLTLGIVDTGGDIENLIQKKPGENFDLTKLSWIGQAGYAPNVLITSPSTGVTTFSQLLSIKTPVKVLSQGRGMGDMFDRVFFEAFNIPHKLVTGFAATAELKQGFLAGEGHYLFEDIPALLTLLDGGQAKALVVTSEPTLPKLKQAVKNAITINQALSSGSLTSAEKAAVNEAESLIELSYDFSGPPGIPAARLAVLQSAFRKAMSDPSTIAEANKESIPLGYVTGQKLASQVSSAVKQGSALSAYIS